MTLLAHLRQRELKHVAKRKRLVGGSGDPFQQLKLLLVVIQLAQPLFGNCFCFEACRTLAV